MNPGSIAVDPVAPEANVTIKAPPGSEHWCGDLDVRLACNHAGQVGFVSEWIPTDDERALIAAGAPVRTFICGRALPPQSVWVKGPEEV